MLRNYAPLQSFRLMPNIGFAQPTQDLPERVALDDPAVSVMNRPRTHERGADPAR